jgi:hypothetical protein
MMKNHKNQKHEQTLPNIRKIKRTCNKELYRTVKRLKTWISPEQISKAEQFYFKKVILNFPWISENGSDRKKLADWWEEHCCSEIAELWEVDPNKLSKAFRDSFGG